MGARNFCRLPWQIRCSSCLKEYILKFSKKSYILKSSNWRCFRIQNYLFQQSFSSFNCLLRNRCNTLGDIVVLVVSIFWPLQILLLNEVLDDTLYKNLTWNEMSHGLLNHLADEVLVSHCLLAFHDPYDESLKIKFPLFHDRSCCLSCFLGRFPQNWHQLEFSSFTFIFAIQAEFRLLGHIVSILKIRNVF